MQSLSPPTPRIAAALPATVRYALPTTTGEEPRNIRPVPAIFGHKTLVACSDEHFVIADSDLETVKLLDRQADVVMQFSLPGRRRSVSSAEVESQRRLRVAADRRQSRIQRRRYEHMSAHMAAEFEITDGISFPDLTIDDMSKVPANNIAPPVDRLFVDASNRVWIRLLPLPDDDAACWHIWDIEQNAMSFLFRIPPQFDVVDAYDNEVLLHAANNATSDRLFETQMIRSISRGDLPASMSCHSSEEHMNPEAGRMP